MKFKIPSYLLAGLAAFGAAVHTVPGQANTERWYSKTQVQKGEALFATHCASCHGTQAEGLAEDWRKTDADGNYPPPPLNGSAHAWHHPMKVLRMTIREGGAKFGGKMPPFKDKLKAGEMDAIIAWFQSHWGDEIYKTWQERDQAAGGFKPVSSNKPLSDKTIKPLAEKKTAAQIALQRLLPGIDIEKPTATPVSGIVAVSVGRQHIYITEDGSHAFTGDLIDLTTGNNLTEAQRRKDRLAQLEKFPLDHRIIYPANGDEKAHITIFTDTSCPFCKKQHKEINVLRNKGVSVHYIPFPRGGRQGPGYLGLRTVWCAADPITAMDTAKNNAEQTTSTGDCKRAEAVDAGYRLGTALGIRGTPASVLSTGELIDGYRSAESLLKTSGL